MARAISSILIGQSFRQQRSDSCWRRVKTRIRPTQPLFRHELSQSFEVRGMLAPSAPSDAPLLA